MARPTPADTGTARSRPRSGTRRSGCSGCRRSPGACARPRRRHRVQVVALVVGQRDRDALRARGLGQVRVHRERGVRVDHVVPGSSSAWPASRISSQEPLPTVTWSGRDAVALGQRAAQGAGGAVGVAVQQADAGGQRALDLRQRRERALVRGQLDRGVEAEAGEDLGRGQPGLVARDGLSLARRGDSPGHLRTPRGPPARRPGRRRPDQPPGALAAGASAGTAGRSASGLR